MLQKVGNSKNQKPLWFLTKILAEFPISLTLKPGFGFWFCNCWSGRNWWVTPIFRPKVKLWRSAATHEKKKLSHSSRFVGKTQTGFPKSIQSEKSYQFEVKILGAKFIWHPCLGLTMREADLERFLSWKKYQKPKVLLSRLRQTGFLNDNQKRFYLELDF